MRYAIVQGGVTINEIEYDGDDPLTLPSGQTLVPAANAPPQAPRDPPPPAE